MATIIRVKRRREDDPLETLVVQCKKQKEFNTDTAKDGLIDHLRFAGTVLRKNDEISRKIREAIRKDKIRRELKQNIVNPVENNRNRYRKAVKNARFTIVSSHRALELENFDSTNTEDCLHTESKRRSENLTKSNCLKCNDKRKNEEKKYNCIEDHESVNSSQSNRSLTDTETKIRLMSTELREQRASLTTNSSNASSLNKISTVSCDSKNKNASSSEESNLAQSRNEKIFQLYDVEIDGNPFPSYDSIIRESQSACGITCNAVPMVREVIPRTEQEDYVYDLYYTNNRDFHEQLLQGSLSLTTVDCPSFCFDDGLEDDSEERYEDEDDENEECNWRNDYPDEDPRYFENQEVEYYYGEDINPYEAFDDDENCLSEWMSTRCQLEGDDELSSPEEDLHYDQLMDPFLRGSSYDNCYKRVQAEMKSGDT